jgi:hypothetical protein
MLRYGMLRYFEIYYVTVRYTKLWYITLAWDMPRYESVYYAT